MKKVLGIFCLLLFVFLATALMSDAFLKPFNLENLLKRSSLFGIISIGVAFVIITGGIDLSIGSVICLVGCGLPFLLQVSYVPLDEVPLTGDQAVTTTVVAPTPTTWSPGDRLRFTGGDPDKAEWYRVVAVAGATLTLDPALKRGAARGRLERVLPLERDEGGVFRVPGHSLQPRDRVKLIDARGREGATLRVHGVDGQRLEFSEPPTEASVGVVGLKRTPRTSVPVALAIVLLASLAIGLFHGLLIARLKLQPFVVTLCGLLLYRGITRGFTEDQTQGLADEYPVLKLVATAELAQVSSATALMLLGGLLAAVATGWGWLHWRRRSPLRKVRPAAIPLAFGLVLLVTGWIVMNRQPVIPVAAELAREVMVDLPEGTRRVRVDVRTETGGWVLFGESDVESSDEQQQLGVPSLETMRGAKPGDWSRLRVVVVDRELPQIGLPAPVLILLLVATVAAVFLNHTIYGRYLLAMGNNEEAAHYSGINTERMTIVAYVICAGLSGLGGVLFVLDINSAQPVDFGNFYELYAIAAAVLGGCSLRGGEGTILGVVIGAALMRVLKNMITLVDWIPTHIEYAIIGAVILVGVAIDELVKRVAARRRAQRIRAQVAADHT